MKMISESSHFAVMAPPSETPVKGADSQPTSRAPLNERILSSLTRRSVAAHPWHDLEIGVRCFYFLAYNGRCIMCGSSFFSSSV